jgi:hypothetical protein
MAKAHPISQARRCKLSSVLLLIAAMTVRERFVTKRANLRTSTSARLRSDSVYASTHVCGVPSDGMDPTTRGAGVRPEVACLQKHGPADKRASRHFRPPSSVRDE